MKTLIIILLLISSNLYAQSLKTIEIKIEYTNALEVFNVFETNPQIDYMDAKEYFWYTDFSGIKSTKGGSGGQLLHGDLKLFDEDGDLIEIHNYKNGLKHGRFTRWVKGEIVDQKDFAEGDLTYWKFHELGNDGTEYIKEWIGRFMGIGFKRRTHLRFGGLIQEEEVLNDGPYLLKVERYYPFSLCLRAEFMTSGPIRQTRYGDYKEYFENGNLKVKGEFAETVLDEFRIGKWIWYKENGEVEDSVSYKLYEEKYNNGNISLIGSLIYDSDNEEWVRHGIWRTFYENGHGKKNYEYEWGELKNNE